MIKANDLRCGNLVRIKEHFYEGAITYIDAENGIVKTDVPEFYNLLHFNDIEPIELTPELLGKIGGCEMIHDGYYNLTWELKHRERFITIKYSKPDKTWRVTFVSEIILQHPTLHWLQNVIYYNWGTELSITL